MAKVVAACSDNGSSPALPLARALDFIMILDIGPPCQLMST